MLTIPGLRLDGFCDRASRRQFLRIGTLAPLGLAGPSLADVLRADETAPRSARPKSVIMIYLPGGPPHQDMVDLKPEAPSEVRGEFRPIATSVPGIRISEHFPRLADRTDRLCLVRSMTHDNADHTKIGRAHV